MSVKTIDLNRFKNSTGFFPTFSCKFGNSRKANIGKVTLNPSGDVQDTPGAEAKAKARMALKKQLIVSPEYEAIRSFQAAIRSWVYEQTVPSFFKEGFQLCKLEAVEPIEKRMRKAASEELPALVEKFIAAYPRQVDEARAVLEPVGQFNALDYPATSELSGMFSITWNWCSFTIPEGLPPELRAAEEGKLKKQFEDAGEQITLALRVAFQELIAHAAERLTEAPGEKRKVIRDSMLGNVQAFLDTFEQRDLMNDVELAQLVAQARLVILPLTPQKLRDVAMTREGTRAKFEAIRTQIDGMITTQRGRKIDLAAEAADEAA